MRVIYYSSISCQCKNDNCNISYFSGYTNIVAVYAKSAKIKELQNMTVGVIRTLILYIVVIFSVRFMGKRQIGQMQPTELVITILISNIATLSLEDPDAPLLTGVTTILFLVSFDVIISVFTMKSKKFRQFVSGSPQILISNGILDREKLKTLRMSEDDLTAALRGLNIFNISEVQFAVVETNGQISAYQKEPYRNAEKRDITEIKKK